jgi:Nucleoside-diphosphate-sugar epimerases
MRIGVTGAFGFLGANFIAALLEMRRELLYSRSDLEIRAFASRTRSNPIFDPSEVEIVDLDVMDRDSMAGKFAGLDAVAHFAGIVDYRSSMRRAVWDTDALGAQNLFEAAIAAGVKRVLYVSSICALGHGSRSDRLAVESGSPYGDPHWPISFASADEALSAIEASRRGDYRFLSGMRVAYLDAKLAGWELAKRYARESGLEIVTIFPGTAVGPGDLHDSIAKLVRIVWEGKLRVTFPGETSFVDARDLARGAVLALERGRSGEGYVIGGRDEHCMGYSQFMDQIAALARSEGWWIAQRHPPICPRPLLLAIAGTAQMLFSNASLTPAFVLSGAIPNACSSAKAMAELGYEPAPSLDPAILACRRFSESCLAPIFMMPQQVS